MKKTVQFLTSMPVVGFLLLLLAFTLALATFIETSWGTEAAKNLIYNAHWFEAILFLLGIGLVANFFRNRLYQWKKIAIGLFHLSFILILTGAAITRYMGSEGVIHIREGQHSTSILTTDTYLTLQIPDKEIKKKVLFSGLSAGEFDERLLVNGQSVRIQSVGFVKGASRTLVEHENGFPVIDFVISAGEGMENRTFRQGEKIDLEGLTIGFREDTDISLVQEGDSLVIVSKVALEKRSMRGSDLERIPAGTKVKVREMSLYGFDGYLLLIKRFYPKALIRVARDLSGNSAEDAVVLEVSDGQQTDMIPVFGTSGLVGDSFPFTYAGTKLVFRYGSERIELPFELYLRDFQLENYIGSESPSSYASELTLIDKEHGIQRDVRVFMNNTLKYRGYRFYQSSYDRDQKGTILSVNKDFWGTFITYTGYFLMTLGMVLALLSRKSYFRHLIRRLKRLNSIKTAVLIIVFLTLGYPARANDAPNAGIPSLDPQLVEGFSELWVHGKDGRIEPMSTLSGEIVRKISRKSSLYRMSSGEIVLSMNLYPDLWQSVQMIRVDKEIAVRLGISGKYASVSDFYNEKGQYLLQDAVRAAYEKPSATRNQLDKNYLYADERLNVCLMVYRGTYFTLFPPQNQQDAWYAPGDKPKGYSREDSLFVNRSFGLLKESLNTGSNSQCLQIIASITGFQEKYGSGIFPSNAKKATEIFYNKIQPFKRIFPVYLALGFAILVILFINIFRQKQINRKIRQLFTLLIVLGFVFHSFGLILRWYIAGHAPWSNGYESMVYVAWAAMLAGIIFGRKYQMVLGTAAFLSGLTLFVAHLNWMNPEITNLVPVLKSHWLLSHVAVITASYGFIGLSAFLGILVMTLYAIMKDNNRNDIDRFIEQLTTIGELSATLGLYLLIIGSFLGAVWANESWGRYWGWDPKETWALITVLVYAFIVHMRFIPSLHDRFIFNLAALLGFSSVLMTYFGVNYYLSGKHSYGNGNFDGIHWPVYVCVLLIMVLIALAYSKYKKHEIGKGAGEQVTNSLQSN